MTEENTKNDEVKCCPHTGTKGDAGGKKNCCGLKFIASIVAMTAAGCFAGWLTWANLFNDIITAPEYADVWRPMKADEWKLMPVAHALHGLFFVIAFCRLGCNITSKCGTNFGKGAVFGFYIWLFVGLMGSVWMYIVYPVSIEIASIVAIETFITNVIGGGIVGVIKGKKKSCTA